MKHSRSLVVAGLLGFFLSFCLQNASVAQFSYTFYPSNATIDNAVGPDYAIVGFSGGEYDANTGSPNFTGPSSPTIQVVTGANVQAEMDIFNQSTVNASGGHIDFVVPMNNSTLNLSGTDTFFVLAFDQSVINMSGGMVGELDGQGNLMNISGGQVGTLVANGSTTLFGDPLGSAIVNVTGGTFSDNANAYNEGILNIFGGAFESDLYARFGGTINLFGSGLSATLLDPNYQKTYSLYSLSGTLLDGTVLGDQRLFVENDGVTYGHSSFTISNVPEPGSVGLLAGLAAPACLLLQRRRGRRSATD